jgi:hypothetical protein
VLPKGLPVTPLIIWSYRFQGSVSDKYNAVLIISRVVIDALQGLEMSYPNIIRAWSTGLRAVDKQPAK